ncbi:MAG: efflux RND transporter periplasmic adaptor subunit [Anaerolineae bacterium]
MKRRWPWIVLAFAVVALLVWYFQFREAGSRTTAAGEGVIVQAVQRGPFEAVVSATGSVRAERTQRLAFQASGTVTDVLVKELDPVVAGQVVARLDDSDVRLGLAQAQAALAIAQAQLARTQAGPSEADLLVSGAALAVAEIGVQTAQAGVDGARASQQRILAGPAPEELAIAERRVDEARNALWGAQAQRDAICGRVGVGAAQADCDQAQASVNRSEVSVSIAELQVQQLKAGASPADVASARAQVDQALSQLASARAQLQRAEAEAARSSLGATPEDIAVAQAQVNQAQVGVDVAASRMDDLVLLAPADGVVASVALLVGDTAVAGNPVVTLIDSEAYHVVLSIDETEIGRIAPGQDARVTLDAYPGTPLTGRVGSIGAVGTDVQGIVVFQVRVDLDPSDLALRPFMTAAVDLVVMQAEDALLVPNRAVRRDAAGRYVETLSGGQLVRTPIELGASNTENSVVVSGLDEGDEVVVSRPRDALFQFSLEGMNAD